MGRPAFQADFLQQLLRSGRVLRHRLALGPGLGVELDRDKLAQYAELYKEVGGYTYDRDPGRPGWYSVIPEQRYAEVEG